MSAKRGRGRTLRVPEGLSAADWTLVLSMIFEQSIREVGPACMSVGRRPDAVWIIDPHGHLHDPEFRAALRAEIRSCCDPMLASIVTSIVLGHEA